MNSEIAELRDSWISRDLTPVFPLFPLTPAAGWLPGSWCCSVSSCKHRGIHNIAEYAGMRIAISIKIVVPVAPVTVCAFLPMVLSPVQAPVLLAPAPPSPPPYSYPSPCSPYFSATKTGGTLYLPLLLLLLLLLLPFPPYLHTTLLPPPFFPTSFAFVSFYPVHIKAIKFPPNSTIPSTK